MVGVFAVGVLASCDEEQDQDIFGTNVKTPSPGFKVDSFQLFKIRNGSLQPLETGDRIYLNNEKLVVKAVFNENVTAKIRTTTLENSAISESFIYDASVLDSSNYQWSGYSDNNVPFEKDDNLIVQISFFAWDQVYTDTLTIKGVPTP